MPSAASARKLIFDDPRLGMTVGGRILVRAVTWIFYVCFAAATFLGLFSDIPQVRWLAMGCALFLVDRLVHRGEADVPLAELPEDGAVNIAQYLRPKTFS